ncbi:hypothetical protein C2845_PM11G09170 [Panicum miliaceum]|uniref:Uncharacterized protein n=1 Tax=Panicum miliaceum TaxID=4540 RepID=A0A3L6RWG6_PANMI|nr:hypothetical protein C2845_PM11G09170 [Panicum miliaceum]
MWTDPAPTPAQAAGTGEASSDAYLVDFTEAASTKPAARNIIPTSVNSSNDPTQTGGSMVFNLLNEASNFHTNSKKNQLTNEWQSVTCFSILHDPLQANSRQPPGPLPDLFFVEQERDAMGPPRITTAMIRGGLRKTRVTRDGTRATTDGASGTRARGTTRRGRSRDIVDNTYGRANKTRGRCRKRTTRDYDSTREPVAE